RGRNPRDLRTVLEAIETARSVARSHRADTDVHPRYGELVSGQPGAQAHSFRESPFGELEPHLAAPPRSEGTGDRGSVGNVSAGIRRRQGAERIRSRNHRAAQNELGRTAFS